jgi:hypothetical protein
LRAAHDTVLAPLLATLGWTHRAYPWPGYAARLVLELWQEGGGAAPRHFVRAVYNGRDVTGLTRCGAGGGGARGGDDPPCSLAAFRALVEGLIAPSASFEERCADESALTRGPTD